MPAARAPEPKTIARRWDRYAPVYDRLVGLSAQRRRSLELAELRAGERVAILGVGSGLDLPLLPDGVRTTGVDLSPAMLRRAQQRADAVGAAFEARLGNAEALDLPAGGYDAVVLHLIVAVAYDPVAVLREAVRIVRHGGRIAVLDKFAPEGRPPSWLRRAVEAVARPLATSVTVRLEEVAAAARARVVHRESAPPLGLLTIARLEPEGPTKAATPVTGSGGS